MNTWTFFVVETGLPAGRSFGGDRAMLEANTPEGCVAVEGQFDHLSQRLDLATGQVVDWQPPAPPDTDLVHHEWNPDIRRWAAQPTALARERTRQEAVVRRIEQVEAQQARPMRELVLDPANGQALARLQQLQQKIDDLRAELAAEPVAERQPG